MPADFPKVVGGRGGVYGGQRGCPTLDRLTEETLYSSSNLRTLTHNLQDIYKMCQAV